MVKMVDVAKHAEVSVKTVSRVLNNEPHVKEDLRKRVLKAIKALNYVPSIPARNLSSSRSYAIHLIAYCSGSNYINAIQSGALQACRKLGYNLHWTLLDLNIAQDPEQLERWCASFVLQRRPDGVILTPPYASDEAVNFQFNELNIPIVRVGPNNIDDNQITVKIDDRLAALEATEYLIDAGHRRIALIRGIENQNATHERFKGYRDALDNNDIEFDEDIVFPGSFSFKSGLKAAEEIIAMADRPSAVFATNDDMAVGVIVAAHKNNLSIPSDLSIIGFDDTEMSERIWPSLTTMRQPRSEFGERAVEMLAAQIGKQKTDVSNIELMDYKLIIRDSTGPKTA